jgi:virulence-associated protein VagC
MQMKVRVMFDRDEVFIKNIVGAVILIPYHAPWKMLVDSLGLLPVDFMEDYEQSPIQDCEDIFLN